MSRVHLSGWLAERPAILQGKNFHVRHCMQTFRPKFCIPAMLKGTIDFNHFIPLSLTSTLVRGHKVSAKQYLLVSFFTLFPPLIGMKFDGWWSNSSWTSWHNFWMRFFFFVFVLFFAFPSYISGVHHFWVRFLRMWPFFNPTIKVVTFRLHGWCVLGVFLLPAFTCLAHERQDLLSPCMCAQTRPRFILSSERVFWGMEFEPMLTPREKSPLPENFPRGGSNLRRCGQRAQTLPISYFGPPEWDLI